MKLRIFKDPDELSHAVADWMVSKIMFALSKQDRFTLALSGGSTPKMLHKILSGDRYKHNIDWKRIHIFWGDERAVSFEDERNNARMAFDTLLDQVPVDPDHIHVMRTDIPPEESAAAYEKILHTYFDGTPASFDLVLLGMGDDGHTLSLFPGTEIVHEQTAWVKAFFLASQDMFRISLTAPIVNKSASIAFLAAGSNKSKSLVQVLEGPFQPDTYPSQVIRPQSGELHWFIDEAAAASLTKKE